MEERLVWEPLVKLFARKSVDEILEEMLGNEQLGDAENKAMDALFSGQYKGMIVYALERDCTHLFSDLNSAASDAGSEWGLNADDEGEM